ncbi:DNA polymerase III subunit gamma/tau [candidate division WWE3 bacterium]|nr:DNA polymerase III subunit gamma/tau [candidate division WWE3 bacterium]
MFYLKYRPQKFSELVKPNPIADALATQVKNGNLSHAYLFIGPRGTGKTTTARLLAKAANCTNIQPNGDPCDTCPNCKTIKKGNFLDLIEIDAASNRGIDDIRNLRDRIGLAPSQGTKKVYIIDEVHMLTKEAFNALLKTLEEPPEHALFVLCTTEPHKVLDTIKSRCQVFNFRRASMEQLVAKLGLIASEEGVGEEVAEATLRKIAQASFGGYRDAETMLQQVIQGSLDPESLFGFSSYVEFHDFVAFLVAGEAASALEFLEEKFASGVDMEVWSYQLLEYLKSLLFVQAGAKGVLSDVTEEVAALMEEQAAGFSVEDLVFYTRKFLQARNEIAESNIATLPLELAVAEICGGGDSPLRGQSSKKPVPFLGKGMTNISTSTEERSSSKPTPVEENPSDASKPCHPDENQGPESRSKSGMTDGGGMAEASRMTGVSELENGSGMADGSRMPDGSEGPSPKKAETKSPIDITASEIAKKWNDVLRSSRKYNHSVRALLKAAEPVEVKGDAVVLEVEFAFHKDRLEYTKNRRIVETVFSEVFDMELSLECVVKASPKKRGRETGELTDLNVVVPSMQSSEVSLDGSLLEVFDGGLPGV